MFGDSNVTATPSLEELEAARLRYREERDRRVRTEGEDQYLEVRSDFASFAADPFVTPGFTREPLVRDHDVIVVGGGFAGLVQAVKLHDEGIRDVAIIDLGGDFGGAWYWNRYPNAQCDVESYCYLPLLEETGYVPEHKYSYQPEILAHAQRIGNQYGLYDNAIFQTEVTTMTWDDDAGRWRLETNRGDQLSARFVVHAMGPGTKPKLPKVPGIETFKGAMFHTSRWNYDYTGGGPAGDLEKLRDKKVGFVGTGSTGIGAMPYIARDAGHLFVFQRTPAMVLKRDQETTDHEWAKTLPPGWQRARRNNFDDILLGHPVEEDLVGDGWTALFSGLRPDTVTEPEYRELDAATRGELADLRMLNSLRARVEAIVEEAEVAETLKPYYRANCKRPTFSDIYLDIYNQPNVTLVDVSRSRGIERFTPTGVVVDGTEYELDCVILSTGFEWGTSLDRRLSLQIVGRNGEELHEHWAAGFRTFHGHSTPGFPNWFYIGRTQSGTSANYLASIDGQAVNVAHIVSEVVRRRAASVEATEEGEQAWLDELHRLNADNTAFFEACTPGYYNNEGQTKNRLNRFMFDRYTPGVAAFDALTASWRERGDLDGMRLNGLPTSVDNEPYPQIVAI